MQRIAVIINPISGSYGQKNTKHSLIKTLRRYAQRKLLKLTIYRTHKAKQATELAAKAIQNGNDLVICCGGDGSINETALALSWLRKWTRPTHWHSAFCTTRT